MSERPVKIRYEDRFRSTRLQVVLMDSKKSTYNPLLDNMENLISNMEETNMDPASPAVRHQVRRFSSTNMDKDNKMLGLTPSHSYVQIKLKHSIKASDYVIIRISTSTTKQVRIQELDRACILAIKKMKMNLMPDLINSDSTVTSLEEGINRTVMISVFMPHNGT